MIQYRPVLYWVWDIENSRFEWWKIGVYNPITMRDYLQYLDQVLLNVNFPFRSMRKDMVSGTVLKERV